MDDTRARSDLILLNESSTSIAHFVGSDQIWATSLGWSPRAECAHVFTPAAMAEPLSRPCPACVATLSACSPRPSRCRPWRTPSRMVPRMLLPGRSR